MTPKIRYVMRKTKKSEVGKHAIFFGVRFGYWPCLKAPFFGIDILIYRFEVWWGYESYKINSKASR